MLPVGETEFLTQKGWVKFPAGKHIARFEMPEGHFMYNKTGHMLYSLAPLEIPTSTQECVTVRFGGIIDYTVGHENIIPIYKKIIKKAYKKKITDPDSSAKIITETIFVTTPTPISTIVDNFTKSEGTFFSHEGYHPVTFLYRGFIKLTDSDSTSLLGYLLKNHELRIEDGIIEVRCQPRFRSTVRGIINKYNYMCLEPNGNKVRFKIKEIFGYEDLYSLSQYPVKLIIDAAFGSEIEAMSNSTNYQQKTTIRIKNERNRDLLQFFLASSGIVSRAYDDKLKIFRRKPPLGFNGKTFIKVGEKKECFDLPCNNVVIRQNGCISVQNGELLNNQEINYERK